MKNWKIYMYLILVYVLMQVGSIFLAEAMVNYLSERTGFTKEQAAYSGIAWSLFIVNTIAAIVFLLLIMPNKKFLHVFKGKRASWGSVILWGCARFLPRDGRTNARRLN